MHHFWHSDFVRLPRWFNRMVPITNIKHGQVDMLTTVGYTNQKFRVHFTLYIWHTGSNSFSSRCLSTTNWITFTDIANVANSVEHISMIPGAGLLQIIRCFLILTPLSFCWRKGGGEHNFKKITVQLAIVTMFLTMITKIIWNMFTHRLLEEKKPFTHRLLEKNNLNLWIIVLVFQK